MTDGPLLLYNALNEAITSTTEGAKEGMDTTPVNADIAITGTLSSTNTPNSIGLQGKDDVTDDTQNIGRPLGGSSLFVHMPQITNAVDSTLQVKAANINYAIKPFRTYMIHGWNQTVATDQLLNANGMSFTAASVTLGINHLRNFYIYVASGTEYVQCEYVDSNGDFQTSAMITATTTTSTVGVANAINVNRMMFFGGPGYVDNYIVSGNVLCKDSVQNIFTNAVSASNNYSTFVTVPNGHYGILSSISYNYTANTDSVKIIVVDGSGNQKQRLLLTNTTVNRFATYKIGLYMDALDSVYIASTTSNSGNRRTSAFVNIYKLAT